MSYSKSSSTPPSGGTTSKYQNKNLNATYNTTLSNRTQAGKSQVVYAAVGTRKVGKPVGAAAAPIPVNTPSIKKENNGKDVTVPLVPSGSTGGVWGVGGGETKSSTASAAPADGSASHTAPVAAKPAPWARPTTENAETSNSSEVKPKATHTPSKSWADAESDEEDEDEVPDIDDEEPAPPATQQQQPRRWDVPPPSYQGGVPSASNLNQNRIYQRDTVIHQQPPAHAYNQNSFNNHNNNASSSFHSSNSHFGGRPGSFHGSSGGAGSHPDSADYGRSQIETSRMELQLLEQRKQRQQESSSASAGGPGGFNHFHTSGGGVGGQPHQQQQSSYFRGFGGPPAAQQQHYSGSGLLNSDSSRDYRPRSGSHGGQEESATLWKRAEKKPIEAPSSASTQQQQQHEGGHFQPRFRGNPSGVVGPPSSRFNNNSGGQYPQMSRPRGPSEDLSMTESGASSHLQQQQQSSSQQASRTPLYKLNSEVPHAQQQQQQQQQQRSETFDMRSLERHGGDGGAGPTGTSPASRRKMLFDPKSSQFVDSTQQHQQALQQHHQQQQQQQQVPVDRWERVPRRPAPADPNAATASAAAPTGAAAAADSESKFAPTLLKKPSAPKSDMMTPPSALSTATTSAAPAPYFKDAATLAAERAASEAEYAAKLEADRAERQKERLSRGPRTKGQLYRYNSEGEIERVLSELEEAVQEAAKKRAKEERRAAALAEAAAAAAAQAASAAAEDEGEEDRRGGSRRGTSKREAREPRDPREPREPRDAAKEPRVKKERKPLSKKNSNYDVFPSAEETHASTAAAPVGGGLNADEIQKIASGTASDPLSLSYLSAGLGSLQLNDDTRGSKLASWSSPLRGSSSGSNNNSSTGEAASTASATASGNAGDGNNARTLHWGSGGAGLQMMQPQQNPHAELDHSLSLNIGGEFDGILGSLSGNGNQESWTYSNFDARPPTANYFEFGGLQIEGSLLSSSIAAATSANAAAHSSVDATHSASTEVKPERVKRGSKFDKANSSSHARSERPERPEHGERPERPERSDRPERADRSSGKPFAGRGSSGGSGGRGSRSRPPLDDSTDDPIAAILAANAAGGSSRPSHPPRERPTNGSASAGERPARKERPERASSKRGQKPAGDTTEK